MSYFEPDCCYCKTCYVKLRKPSKKAIKRLVLTEYKDQCECCQKIDRLVEYDWEDDNDDEE